MTKNLAASIHQRLLNLARRENRTLNELLQYFAIERFLFRLGQTKYRQVFVLKGAQMLRVWNAPAARPTMDIDLLGKVENNLENLEEIVRECCLVEVDDGVIFDAASVKAETIRKDGEYQGIKVLARGLLGKIKLNLQIDVGFGDAVIPAPVEIELPQLLDLGKPVLLGYTPESAIAEKLQAMVALDMVNTRMKDFYDIWLLSTTLDFDNEVLAAAIRETFKRRQTPLPSDTPTALTPAFTEDETKKRQWQAFLRKNRLDESIGLDNVAEVIRRFLLPLL
ncbi:MAG: nucleotidyl transferase AbiEii/AbiGii toxin family protein [Pyrinomonadaceae bacterium]